MHLMCAYPCKPIDIGVMRTRSIRQRASKVRFDEFAKVYEKGSGVKGLLNSLPHILAGVGFRSVVQAILEARARQRAVIWALGAHVIKCGLNPILIELMKHNFISTLALNGAGAIHDFEIAIIGSTSEDVEKELAEGDFGTGEETAQWMNEAIRQGAGAGKGVGESLGECLTQNTGRFPYLTYSLLASAYSLEIPVTVHIALGTDTIHNHPAADGSALGKGSLQDFRVLTSLIRNLHDGGVFLNCGSAVILPEVFLKAFSMVRNLGYPLENFTTVDMDFLQHYRPIQNVVKRPTLKSGQGISLTGHHELMIPLLAASLIETGL